MNLFLKPERILWAVVISLSLLATSVFAETYFDYEKKKYERHVQTPEELKALKIAEEVCKQERWEWKDVSIESFRDYWHVTTNSSADGGNAEIDIDKKTGKVLEKWFNGR
jgi:hypothetical protein